MDRIQNVLAASAGATGAQSPGMTRATQMLSQPHALPGQPGTATSPAFSNILTEAIQSVHQAQSQAGVLQKAYQQGNSEVSLEHTMIAMNKASLSFQMLAQARNRVVAAYNEVMNMPV